MFRKTFLILFLVATVILAAAGCSTSSVVRDPGENADFGELAGLNPDGNNREAQIDFPDHCGDYVIKPLIGGQNILVGYVATWNDDENLYVHYRTVQGWELGETHLAVATSLIEIPHGRKGNPKIGHFPYKGEHDPSLTDVRYTIPLEWAVDIQLYLAAHAVVYLYNDDRKIVQEETAWGDGCFPCFDSPSWAMFFTFSIQACPE